MNGIQQGTLQIVISDPRAFTRLLSVIYSSSAVHCTWVVKRRELRIGWENNSKSMQAEILFPAEVFSSFSCNVDRMQFNIYMKHLIKVLEFMSVVHDVPMEITYPGEEVELCFRSFKNDGGLKCWEYVNLKTKAGNSPISFTDTWTYPETSFITKGAVMKSLVEDIPAVRQPIRLVMQKDINKVQLKAQRAGLQMEVSVDANGLMKVMHILNLSGQDSLGGAGQQQQLQQSDQGTLGPSLYSAQTVSNSVTVWFMCKAQLVEEDPEPGDAEQEQEP
eukprot:TRINITY_DN3360_c0_g2_i3.p1 TRINITY_DN3360_c0_g2~~TRINITY_DN3360_c0_g2_i3.p1  ORF type:complete len:276 (+),score=21.78 TRINITY_DN3360_c0_g2_i3:169-996(+)